MWPILFGSGWIWGVLVAAALLCFVVGGLGFLLLVTGKPSRRGSDDLGEAWHRYEEGDLTQPEWERTAKSPQTHRKVAGAGHP